MPWFAAAAAAVFYLYHVPLTFALVWENAGHGGGFALFEGRLALKRARSSVGRTKKRSKKVAWETVRALLPCLVLEEMTLRLSLGTSDAAVTALLCGALRSVGCALRRKAERGAIDVRPDFSGTRLEGEFRVVLRVGAGEAVMALIREKLGIDGSAAGRNNRPQPRTDYPQEG